MRSFKFQSSVENCIRFEEPDMKWADNPCDKTHKFICEGKKLGKGVNNKNIHQLLYFH